MVVMYIEHKGFFFFFPLDFQALQQYCIKVVLVINLQLQSEPLCSVLPDGGSMCNGVLVRTALRGQTDMGADHEGQMLWGSQSRV